MAYRFSSKAPFGALLLGLAIVAVSALVPGLSGPAARANDWPQFRGPNRNGINPETAFATTWPAAGPARLWSAQLGLGYSGVAVSKGRLYTTGNTKEQDTVFCFDAVTGREFWRITYPAASSNWDKGQSYPGTRATPTVDGDVLYTMSLDSQLQCLKTANGATVWKKNLQETYDINKHEFRYGFASSPLIDGKVLYQSLGAGACALEKDTGKEIWHWHDEVTGVDNVSAGYASPLLFDNGGKKALAVLTKSLVALDPDTGKELWRVGNWQPYGHGLNAADPIFLGDRVFLSQGNYTRDCAVFLFSGGKARKVWRLSNDGMLVHFNNPVLIDGLLYGFHDTKLRCLEFDTGKPRWTTEDEIHVTKYGYLISAGGKLIILSDKGELIIAAVSPEAFKPLVRAQVIAGPTWVAPVLANGLLYCRNNKGELVCLDLRVKGARPSP